MRVCTMFAATALLVCSHKAPVAQSAVPPGVVLPGPNNVEQFNQRTQSVYTGLDVLSKLPGAPEGSEQAVDGVKRLNEARAEAERVMNNPQNFNVPSVPPVAEVTPTDIREIFDTLPANHQAALRQAIAGDMSCEPAPKVFCNGDVKNYQMIECGVSAPDARMARDGTVDSVGVFQAQCVLEGGRMRAGAITFIGKHGDLYRSGPAYRTRITVRDRSTFIYNGVPRTGFCGAPCPDKPFGGRRCIGLPPFVGLCLD